MSFICEPIEMSSAVNASTIKEYASGIIGTTKSNLISYELSMPVRFDYNIRLFCFYHHDDFNMRNSEQMKTICRHHLKSLTVS